MCKCFYLISFFGEHYFCAFFPSRIHIYGQDLVFDTGCVSILTQNLLEKLMNVWTDCLDPVFDW